MAIQIGDLNLGRVDAKLEFSDAQFGSTEFFNSYMVPDNIRIEKFETGDKYFINGFRGTGKTSLLRYCLAKFQSRKSFRKLILFKSDIDEDHRLSLSKQVGFDWIETDSAKMAVSQDFKSAWRWFILHKIGELIRDNPAIVTNRDATNLYLNLLGLGAETTVSKVLGVFPRLKGGNVHISGDLGLVRAELKADFETDVKSDATLSIRALVAAAEKALMSLSFSDRVYIGFDELEAFYSETDKFKRDLSMVRDLLFVIDQLNQKFRSSTTEVFLIAAVRSEVLHSMKSLGHEVERSVHDSGVTLAWHDSARSMDHPILNMIRKKLVASGIEGDDPLLSLMPATVNGLAIDKFLLDSSFYKPRDVVWRLTIIQDRYPTAPRITQQHFEDTVSVY